MAEKHGVALGIGRPSKEERLETLRPTHFKPGDENPQRKAKKARERLQLTPRLLEMLDESAGRDPKTGKDLGTYREIIIRRALIEAGKGHFQYFKEIMDRTDGKVAEKLLGVDEGNDDRWVEIRRIIAVTYKLPPPEAPVEQEPEAEAEVEAIEVSGTVVGVSEVEGGSDA